MNAATAPATCRGTHPPAELPSELRLRRVARWRHAQRLAHELGDLLRIGLRPRAGGEDERAYVHTLHHHLRRVVELRQACDPSPTVEDALLRLEEAMAEARAVDDRLRLVVRAPHPMPRPVTAFVSPSSPLPPMAPVPPAAPAGTPAAGLGETLAMVLLAVCGSGLLWLVMLLGWVRG
jgi:hypothetical protein